MPAAKRILVAQALTLLTLGACAPADEPHAPANPGGERPPNEQAERAGRWRPARGGPTALDPDLDEKIKALEAIGYAAGSEVAEERFGVTAHDRAQAYPGVNLYVSGHAPAALLVDMQGQELHRWECSYQTAMSGAGEELEGEKDFYRDFWRRAHLFDNGDLLAIFEGHAMVKLDARSNLQWTFTGRPHHDLFVDEREHIFVLTRQAHVLPRINATEPILEDFVSELDAEGNELRRVSVLECFENSPFASHLDKMKDEGDVLHTNSLERVDERLAQRLPGVEPGHVLISSLFLDTIAVLDLEAGRAVWALSKDWRWQHDPTVLDSGHIMLFDNLGGDRASGKSRVVEFDPVSEEVLWSYGGSPEAPLESNTCGSCQRLPNGNTLITESDNGRALEVNPAGQIVWEFLNPHRAGNGGRFVATLFEMVRLPLDAPMHWVDSAR